MRAKNLNRLTGVMAAACLHKETPRNTGNPGGDGA
jgi:hypothetical protein